MDRQLKTYSFDKIFESEIRKLNSDKGKKEKSATNKREGEKNKGNKGFVCC